MQDTRKEVKSYAYRWFFKSGNKEEIIDGRKTWMNEKRRAMLYAKEAQEDPKFPFLIKKFYIGDSYSGGLMLTLEGVSYKDNMNLKVK